MYGVNSAPHGYLTHVYGDGIDEVGETGGGAGKTRMYTPGTPSYREEVPGQQFTPSPPPSSPKAPAGEPGGEGATPPGTQTPPTINERLSLAPEQVQLMEK